MVNSVSIGFCDNIFGIIIRPSCWDDAPTAEMISAAKGRYVSTPTY